jgi:hypothetical protein
LDEIVIVLPLTETVAVPVVTVGFPCKTTDDGMVSVVVMT